MKLTLVCRLALSLGLALSLAPAAFAACELQKVAEYPIVMEGYRPLVPGLIDGKPVKFLLDTGSEATVITRVAVKRLGLKSAPLHRAIFYGVGGADYADETTIHEMKLGDATARDVTMFVVGSKDGDEDGLLGENFLSHADLEMDWAHGAIRFIHPQGCSGDQVVYWGQAYSATALESTGDRPVLEVYVELNGRRLLAEIDSGASRSIVTPTGARRAGFAFNAVSDDSVHGIGGAKVSTAMGLFQSFKIGDETIKNVRLTIGDIFGQDTEVGTGSHISAPVDDFPDMLLGADFLRAHRVYVAHSQGKLYFSYLGGPIFQIEQSPASKPAAPKP